MMRTFFCLSAYLGTCLVLLATVPMQSVNVTECVIKPLNLICPDGYKVIFSDLLLGGPGQNNGTQCLPLATDCSIPTVDPMITYTKSQCLWKESSCSLSLMLPIPNECPYQYMTAVDFMCIKDHIVLTTDTEALTIPRNGTTYLTNEDHPKSRPGSHYNVRLESAGTTSGVSLETVYALNTGPCDGPDAGGVIIKTNGEIHGEFCGSDTIKTPCLANVSLEATTGGNKLHKGFALAAESCELPCEDSKWTKVCNPDHVVAARVYSGGPGSREGSRCRPAPGDCRRTVPNASECLWSQSECTFDVATVDGDGCNATYIRADGATCVPKSSVYVLKDAEAAEVVQLAGNGSIYVLSPDHLGLFPENKNFSLSVKVLPGYGISLGTHVSNSLATRDNKSQCPQLNSLRAKAGWSNSNTALTEYVSCGTDEFQHVAVGDQVWFQFRTGSNAENHEGFVLRVESFRLPTSADVSTATSPVPQDSTGSASTEDPEEPWKLTYILAVSVPLAVICLALICTCVVMWRRCNRRPLGTRQAPNNGDAVPLGDRNGNFVQVRNGRHRPTNGNANGHLAALVDPGSICSATSQTA